MEIFAYIAFAIIGITGTIQGMSLPFFIEKFSLPYHLAGLLLSGAASGYLAATLLYPLLARFVSSAKIIAAAFLLLGGGYLLVPSLGSWYLIVFLTLIANLGVGSIDVSFNTLISGLEPARAQVSMNWLHFSYGLGALLGPFFLSRLLDWGASWAIFYFSTGLLGIIYLFAWLKLRRKITISSVPVAAGKSGGNLFQKRTFWLLIVGMFIYVAAEVSLTGWLPTHVKNAGAASNTAALSISVIWLGITLGRALSTFLIKFWQPRALLLLLTAGTGLSMLVLAFSRPLPLIFLTLLFTGLFFSAIFPIIILQGAFLFPRQTPQVTSSLVLAASVGALAGPSFLGVLAERYSLTAGIAILALLMLLTTFLLFFLPGQTPKLARQTKTGRKGSLH